MEPARMFAVVGETVTETEVGFGGGTGPGEADLEPELHEARAMATRKTRRKRNRGRSAEDIVRIVSEEKKEGGNWTEGQKWNRGGKDWPRRHRGHRENRNWKMEREDKANAGTRRERGEGKMSGK